MSQTNKKKSLVSQMVFYIALLVLNCFILIGCNYNNSILDNVSEYYDYRLEMKKVMEWIHYKNPNLSNERVHNLARCYIISARKYNIDYKYTVSLGYIESRYKPNQGYLGNFGVQQINWTAHKSRLKDLYDITHKYEVMEDDEINIDYSSLLVKEMCSDPNGKKCNLNSLTRKYNGRNNLKYKNKLESLLSEFNKIYG